MDKKWPKTVLGLAGYSGSGKTTLLSALIPLLKQRGLKVSVIKHSHHQLELDKPGKDSHQFVTAGASEVILACPHKRYHFSKQQQHDEIQEQLHWVNWQACDLVLVEGYRHSQIPKIEVHRSALNKPLLSLNDSQIIAIASTDELSSHLPKFDLNDPKAVCDFIVTYTNSEKIVK
ncbi:hypothetical protein AHAT_33180 [Agarivorans sp. Toyoura001]|uniref:molybdopterin-guanine dinucleotide biosynthesis protein B n=1 Tax=Agarivorans sp. Toyoura001 TaxID=2283141 RepID=UPI0010E6A2AD|nr:molybdopterin-guanine dinucleotide biosynthesis protein B [Agarivorans sp. Toyoura001]GDY27428.1 hypothetical protein AHAT_33180 [Agarivorans sp. Toyoura001]